MLINENSEKKHHHLRSKDWPKVRNEFLKGKTCAVCGRKDKIEAHHVVPFQIDPSRELDPKNLLALCEGKKTINCHLIIGHGGDYKDVNPYSVQTAKLVKWLLLNKQYIKGTPAKDGKVVSDNKRRFGWLLKGLKN